MVHMEINVIERINVGLLFLHDCFFFFFHKQDDVISKCIFLQTFLSFQDQPVVDKIFYSTGRGRQKNPSRPKSQDGFCLALTSFLFSSSSLLFSGNVDAALTRKGFFFLSLYFLSAGGKRGTLSL